ncbi:galactose oxidase [Cyanobium sp. Morenito 9A2]|uniref:galactose oxidase n=1 Tax=Cyanobium sp. Morenito 9A2 TaxID=2823718 RepID=UPI0020CD1F68|nr:galactose oxidase [Cyanobium sp. Morenito 9A2]
MELLLVRVYFLLGALVSAPPARSRGSHRDSNPSGEEATIEAWPYLDGAVLRPSRSRKVCMTCHFFRHHAGVNCIPLLTCQLHQGLLAQGEHLTRRCQGWTDDMTRQRGWCPEVA